MPLSKIADWSTTPASNTDVGGIALGENVAAMREMNDAIRQMMAQHAVQYKSPSAPASVAVSASAIDCSQGIIFTKTASGGLTWTFTNVPAGTYAGILELTNGGTGTQTFPSGSKWASGGTPTLSASGKDLLTFYTPDGGTTWHWAVRALAVA